MPTARPCTLRSSPKKPMLRALLALMLAAAPALQGAAQKKLELTALEVYENVLKTQKKQASLECDIVREELKGTVAAQKVTGTLKTLRGGKAWLEISAPSRQLLVSDGKALYVELSDVKQVMKYDAVQLKKGGNFFLDLGDRKSTRLNSSHSQISYA